MTGTVLHISSEEDFNKRLEDANARKAGVFVDFFAEWCGPCKMVAPKLDQLAKEFPSVVFLKVDVDQCQTLAGQYGVRAMPTFIGILNGESIGTVVGADLGKMTSLIKELAASVKQPVPA